MEDLPRIFDAQGKFVEPDRSKLAPEAITQLDRVQRAYTSVADQEAIVAKCQEEITASLSAVIAGEKLCDPYGPYTFMSLWRETVKQ
jgi:hypothetical protein